MDLSAFDDGLNYFTLKNLLSKARNSEHNKIQGEIVRFWAF